MDKRLTSSSSQRAGGARSDSRTSGKSILILERGDWLSARQRIGMRPPFVQNCHISPETWYDRDGRPFQPQVHYFVGGATDVRRALSLRKEDRRVAPSRRHLAGVADLLRRTRPPARGRRGCITCTGCAAGIRLSLPRCADPIRARRFPMSCAFSSRPII